jgi:short-subunit dehydrogenase
MTVRLKPVEEQVIVITGASSEWTHDRTHVRGPGREGLVLVSRNEETLNHVADELSAKGHPRDRVQADVARREELEPSRARRSTPSAGSTPG